MAEADPIATLILWFYNKAAGWKYYSRAGGVVLMLR
jgi:hypothetical protein